MNRFEFYDRYRLFVPITHIRLFEQDLIALVDEVAWMERLGREEAQESYSERR